MMCTSRRNVSKPNQRGGTAAYKRALQQCRRCVANENSVYYFRFVLVRKQNGIDNTKSERGHRLSTR